MSRIRIPRSWLVAPLLLSMIAASAQAQLLTSVDLGFDYSLSCYTYDAETGDSLGVPTYPGVRDGRGVAFGPDGLLYVATGVCVVPECTSNAIVALESSDYAQSGTFSLAGATFNVGDLTLDEPQGLVWGIVNGADKLFAASSGSGQVLRYAEDGTLEGPIFTTPHPWGIAVDGNALYIANNDSVQNELYRIDTDTGAPLDDPNDGNTAFVTLGEEPEGADYWRPLGVAVGPTTGDVYLSAAGESGGAVFRISAPPMSNGTIVQSFKDPSGAVLNFPQDLTFEDDGMLYVVDGPQVVRFTADLQYHEIFADSFLSLPQSHLTFVPTACRDGQDNDGDALIDLADPGCLADFDTSEKDAAFACDDGVDNDGNGSIDYPDDSGCSSPTDTLERTTTGGGGGRCRSSISPIEATSGARLAAFLLLFALALCRPSPRRRLRSRDRGTAANEHRNEI